MGLHNVEISGFFYTSDFTWNQFWSFWNPKKCYFDHLSSSKFWIFANFWHFQVWNFCKIQNSMLSRLLKQQYLLFWNQQKLFSHKIRGAGKLLSFHTVEYLQSKFPIRLSRSVHLQICHKSLNFWDRCLDLGQCV